MSALLSSFPLLVVSFVHNSHRAGKSPPTGTSQARPFSLARRPSGKRSLAWCARISAPFGHRPSDPRTHHALEGGTDDRGELDRARTGPVPRPRPDRRLPRHHHGIVQSDPDPDTAERSYRLDPRWKEPLLSGRKTPDEEPIPVPWGRRGHPFRGFPPLSRSGRDVSRDDTAGSGSTDRTGRHGPRPRARLPGHPIHAREDHPGRTCRGDPDRDFDNDISLPLRRLREGCPAAQPLRPRSPGRGASAPRRGARRPAGPRRRGPRPGYRGQQWENRAGGPP